MNSGTRMSRNGSGNGDGTVCKTNAAAAATSVLTGPLGAMTNNNSNSVSSSTKGVSASNAVSTVEAVEASGVSTSRPLAQQLHQATPVSGDSAAAAAAGRAKVEVKLFVGRLPRNIDEASLTPLFTPFGQVLETVIIRDKVSGAHKGSAFIKMASITEADGAVRALHNVKVVDPQLGPIQVKYANGEPERLGLSLDSAQPGSDLGKLFVGSLARGTAEGEVREFFEPFGKIEEVVLMKDPATGASRGCAFVKFTYKEDAINAIKALHGKVTSPGCSRPLEVKFAQNRRAVAPNAMGTGAASRAGQPAAAGGGSGGSSGALGNQQPPQPSNLNPRSAGGWTEYFTADNRAYYHNEAANVTQWSKPLEFERLYQAITGKSSLPAGGGGFSGAGAGGGGSTGLLSSGSGHGSSSVGGGRGTGAPLAAASQGTASSSDVAGPPGANVFIFHVPADWAQNELASHFLPFGNVLSCYIATDRSTGRNKGYGFVSFDNIQSAANAVLGMNGYLVGTKRLKVSIKTGEESYVAHLLGPGAAPAGSIGGSGLGGSGSHHHLQQQAYVSALGGAALVGNGAGGAGTSGGYAPAPGAQGVAALGAYRAAPY